MTMFALGFLTGWGVTFLAFLAVLFGWLQGSEKLLKRLLKISP